MYLDEKEYRAAMYLRLSKEDGDCASGEKAESDSISSQRELIKSFAKRNPTIQIIEEFCDDGYTGTNFERPDFKRMMDGIRKKEFDCILVKDLSRFGRDYIEAGKYIEKIFPELGVRFIAVNDDYDSAQSKGAADSLILPFRNLINDSYSRDISIKVRSNLKVKRRAGEFIANFAAYGYMRSVDNKNLLVVDEDAASVVRDIFRWVIEGQSPGRIAERLNSMGILAPYEYKKAAGSNYACEFKEKDVALWSHVAVWRILTNEVYTGTLVQGKRTTPNYKVKKTIKKDESEWDRVENTHEAIVSRVTFDIVQELLDEDTRLGPGENTVHPFAGKLFCGCCNAPLTKKTTCTGGKKYSYYICSQSKANKALCDCKAVRTEKVDNAVLATIQKHISVILDMDKALEQVEALAWEKREVRRIDGSISRQMDIVKRNYELKTSLYEDLQSELITNDEFLSMKQAFTNRIMEAEALIRKLKVEKSSIESGLGRQQSWLAQFRQYRNITELNRSVVVHLIEHIFIREDNQIDVVFRGKDQFAEILSFISEQKERKYQLIKGVI